MIKMKWFFKLKTPISCLSAVRIERKGYLKFFFIDIDSVFVKIGRNPCQVQILNRCFSTGIRSFWKIRFSLGLNFDMDQYPFFIIIFKGYFYKLVCVLLTGNRKRVLLSVSRVCHRIDFFESLFLISALSDGPARVIINWFSWPHLWRRWNCRVFF